LGWGLSSSLSPVSSSVAAGSYSDINLNKPCAHKYSHSGLCFNIKVTLSGVDILDAGAMVSVFIALLSSMNVGGRIARKLNHECISVRH
jgi:hypothetical protein